MDYPATGPAVDLVVKGTAPRLRHEATAVARAAAVDGIQAQISGWAEGFVGPRRLPRCNDAAFIAQALWLPGPPAGPLHLWRRRRLVHTATSLVDALRATRLVVDRPLSMGPNRHDSRPSAAAELFSTMSVALPRAVRLTVALRPRHLRSGRAHLDEILVLRRFAEEWDLDIALDLTSPCDPQWEAEASIWRLMPRLRIVRFGPLNGRTRHRTEPRLAARVLACLADFGYDGRVAITPTAPGITRSRQQSLADETRSVAGLVRTRFTTGAPHDSLVHNRQRFFSR